MKDPYNDMVREFHNAFGLKVRNKPDVGAPEERVLRVRLMLEEVLEFAKAAGVDVVHRASGESIESIGDVEVRALGWMDPNLTAMAHELGDVLIVAHGTAVQLGFPALPVVTEINGANMRKLGPDGKPIVDERGKVRKPGGWKPADVGAVLNRLNEGEE